MAITGTDLALGRYKIEQHPCRYAWGVSRCFTASGVGERGIADDLVPAGDRHLAGDDQRAGVVAVFDDLQQVALLLGESAAPAPSRPGSADRPGPVAA